MEFSQAYEEYSSFNELRVIFGICFGPLAIHTVLYLAVLSQLFL
jgi:hypothetical protein